jgi:DNA (cytosine-5)-methyltransferase 1
MPFDFGPEPSWRDDSLPLIVDTFAGGGGASTGIEAALGRPVDVALNHDIWAIALHRANHPATRHLTVNVWRADPLEVTAGRRVGLLWASPDCKHFSKAKGGRPVKRNIRDLAWVVVLWARRVRPGVIILENVEEFQDWGPVSLEGRPCPDRKGAEFRRFVAALRRLGYRVDWRKLRACDYGAPTIRKRLFLIARCDGRPIAWPAPTHGPEGSGLLPYRTAADIIDWFIPCPSIFGRKRPLAENTLARIARGIRRFVIEAAEPFIVPVTHHGDLRGHSVGEPLRTITTASRGEMALICPTIVGCGGRAGQSRPRGGDEPFATITSKADACVVAAFLAQHNGGTRNANLAGHDARKPLSTVTLKGAQQQIVASHLVKLRGTCRDGQPVTAPLATVTASGTHLAEVRAFLLKYYGSAVGQDLADPLHSVTSRARFGLVMVHGEPWQIVDIGMRMLQPRELFAAQGFPDDYAIERGLGDDGAEIPLTKTRQVEKCGNSVCPPVARALVAANCNHLAAQLEAAE